MTPAEAQIEALAKALREVYPELVIDSGEIWPDASAILAALDGWTLRTAEMDFMQSVGTSLDARIARQEAEIARLRAALKIIATRPEPGYDASVIVVTARNIARTALAPETKP